MYEDWFPTNFPVKKIGFPEYSHTKTVREEAWDIFTDLDIWYARPREVEHRIDGPVEMLTLSDIGGNHRKRLPEVLAALQEEDKLWTERRLQSPFWSEPTINDQRPGFAVATSDLFQYESSVEGGDSSAEDSSAAGIPKEECQSACRPGERAKESQPLGREFKPHSPPSADDLQRFMCNLWDHINEYCEITKHHHTVRNKIANVITEMVTNAIKYGLAPAELSTVNIDAAKSYDGAIELLRNAGVDIDELLKNAAANCDHDLPDRKPMSDRELAAIILQDDE